MERIQYYLSICFIWVATTLLAVPISIQENQQQKTNTNTSSCGLFFNTLDVKLIEPEKIYKITAITTSKTSGKLFLPPTKGRLTSLFGYRKKPYRGFHSGIDIATRTGTPIRAIADGEVIFVGRKGQYGRIVILAHRNNLVSCYAHCKNVFVEKGQHVGFYTKIASVGSSGRTTGSHLHFEIRKNGKPINPLQYIFWQ